MTADIKIYEEQPFTAWITGIVGDSEEVCIEVVDALGDLAVKESISELKRIQRKGKLPKARGVHMYQDVRKVKSVKYGYVSVGGGKKTATLWHIVNDGTYRSKARHFMERIINKIDAEADRVFDEKGKRLGD
jgi:HK97 gp10 family phage protein